MNRVGPARDPENRSKKQCCCGGHNFKNPKSDKRHHSTAARLAIRSRREP